MRFLKLFFILCVFTGPAFAAADVANVSIVLDYTLNDNFHEMRIYKFQKTITGERRRDGKRIKKTVLPEARFEKFLKRVQDCFAIAQKLNPGSPKGCRSGFKLELKNGTVHQLVEGCRNSELGPEIGRLISDAEFLLYAAR